MVRYVVYTDAPTLAELQRPSESGDSTGDDALVWHIISDEMVRDDPTTQPGGTTGHRQSATQTPPYHVLSKNLEMLASLPRGTLSGEKEEDDGDVSEAGPTSPVEFEDDDYCAQRLHYAPIAKV
jgi:hypothetical protein